VGELGGHHLDDEADPEPEHLAEEAGLSPDAHRQVDHDLLQEGGGVREEAPPPSGGGGGGGGSPG